MRHLALLLSFSVGFLSLSQEIIWVRLVSFAQGGRPQAFSLVLAAFLAGIALGAIVGRRLCRTSTDLPRAAGMVLFVAGAVDLLMLQDGGLFRAVQHTDSRHRFRNPASGILALSAFIGRSRCGKGGGLAHAARSEFSSASQLRMMETDSSGCETTTSEIFFSEDAFT